MNNLNNFKFNCTGCGVCVNACLKGAISLKLNKEGFYQYFIDKDKCVECGICNKICPKLNFENSNEKKDIICYAAYTKDKEVLNNSSSGGLFYEIAKSILEDGGLVAGAIYQDNKVKHVLIDNLKDLKLLQGSKYLQSFTGNIYTEIKKNIKNKKILFSGTPCQCAALRNLVKCDNLIVVDIVCHGVPSLKVFEKSLKDRFDVSITSINFRLKDGSWNNYSIEYIFLDKRVKKIKHYSDEWFSGYLKNLYLMKSCYSCGFNTLPRVGDITLADCWGIINIDKNFYETNKDTGISLVLINNEKGKNLFNKIKKNIIYKEQNINDYKLYNPRIFNGEYTDDMLKKRKEFFDKELNISFKIKRYSIKTNKLIMNKCRNIIKKIIGK